LSRVGKTTLVTLLRGKKFPKETNPTVGLEIQNSMLDGSKVTIWDMGGQERYRFMWKDFMRGAGLAVLVCDSTEENVQKTKRMYEKFSRYVGSKVIAIANKQDLPEALSAEQVEKKLGIPTYGMSAIRLDLRGRMKRILEYELDTPK
jgi:small GTP-binding protein